MSGPARAPAEDLVRILGDILAAEDVEAGEEAATWRVGGRTPGAVALPRSEDQVREVLLAAAAQGWKVAPAGRGLSLCAGEPRGDVDLVLSTRHLGGIVHYEPADLTASARAGTTLDELGLVTGAEGQWLPVEPPGSGAATLGGVLGWGLGGALCGSFGAPRDLVLGLRCVTGDGRILRLGGRVVKNVAGFDLVKLMVGSRGTLGVMTEVTVRLYPVAPARAALVARAGDVAELVPAARALARAPVMPASLELGAGLEEGDGDAGGGGAPGVLVVRLLGNEATVEADARALQGLVPTLERVGPEEGRSLTARLRGLEVGAPVAARLALPPVLLGEGLDLARRLADTGGRAGPDGPGGLRLVADASSGVIRIAVTGGAVYPAAATDEGGAPAWPPALRKALASALMALRSEAERRGGSLTLVQAPADLMEAVGARGTVSPAVARIQRGMRERFDPASTLSPRRPAERAPPWVEEIP